MEKVKGEILEYNVRCCFKRTLMSTWLCFFHRFLHYWVKMSRQMRTWLRRFIMNILQVRHDYNAWHHGFQCFQR